MPLLSFLPLSSLLPLLSPAKQVYIVAGALFLVACGGGGATRVSEKCSQCQDFPEAMVCTAGGNRINSCYALCLEEVLLCYQKCPCPYSEKQ